MRIAGISPYGSRDQSTWISSTTARRPVSRCSNWAIRINRTSGRGEAPRFNSQFVVREEYCAAPDPLPRRNAMIREWDCLKTDPQFGAL